MSAVELSGLDRALGRSLGRGNALAECLIGLTSHALGQGHVCLLLSSPQVLEAVREVESAPPDAAGLLDALRHHPAVQFVAGPELPPVEALERSGGSVQRSTFGLPRDVRPLILDAAGRLYLARYYEHEQRLARAVARRLARRSTPQESLPPRMVAGLDEGQARAVSAALAGSLTVVSGGPGTGKTSTVVRMLAALFEQTRTLRGSFPRVLLLAPTGKAAVRLSAAVLEAKKRLDAPVEVAAALPEQGSTIHRALGVLPQSRTRFRHGVGHPLDADIVVVDEASMVDLALMRHLIEALSPDTSLILLGDRDQLSSVDAGNVLASLCDALEADPVRARGALCQLTRSHRFDGGGLSVFAAAARSGDVVRIRSALSAPDGGVSLLAGALGAADPRLLQLAKQAFQSVIAAPDVATALGRLGAFRVLCAHRTGPFGVTVLNRAIHDALAQARLVPQGLEYFHGRPILVTESDPVLELMNGDVGLLWAPPGQRGSPPGQRGFPSGEAPSVFFERPGRAPLSISPAHLPGHETAFAMTIHKSQGSEFEHVVVVLPPAESPLATRELLYTAITRARRRVTLLGDPAALEVGLGREVQRASGLAAALLAAFELDQPTS